MARGIHCCTIFSKNFFCPTSVSVVWRICVCIYIYVYVYIYIYIYIHTHTHIHTYLTAYELPLLPNETVSDTLFHKSWELRSVDWIFITGAPVWRWLGDYVTLDKVLQPFHTGSSSSPNYCHSFLIIIMLEGAFNRNVISILCINYSNAVINNNYGRLQDLILVFRIPMCTLKEFLRNL